MGKNQSPAAGSVKAEAAPKKEKKTAKNSTTSDGPAKKCAAKSVGKNDDGKSSQKVQRSEIDEIFSAGTKKAQKVSAGKRVADKAAEEEAPATAKRPRVEGSKDDIFGETAGKGRKRTEEGFPIYTEEELGLAKKGGDTDLCPFDCDCCF